jgi:fucose 4-O-acetylase-like acetyltransferase
MRLHWIDSLKGIGIILVVLAHCNLSTHYILSGEFNIYICSFVMPLFFFISGFLFDFGKYAESTINFVKGRFKSIIVPYFFFAILTCIFYILMDTAYQPGVTNIEFFKFGILNGIYSILYAGPLISYNPALWFLTCLFVTELLFYGFSKKYYGEPRKLVFWLTAAGVIGYLYSVYVPFRLPWNADVAFSAVVFYGAGNLFKRITEPKERLKAELEMGSNLDSNSKLRERSSSVEKFFPGIVILLNLLYLAYLLNFPTTGWFVDMNNMEYGSFASFYFLAFSGIFAYIYLFKKIGSSKVLEYYGRNSLIVLAFHLPIRDILRNIAAISFGIKPEYLSYNAAFGLSFTILTLLCMIPLIFLINNYFPFMIGRKGFFIKYEHLKALLKA